MKHVVVLGAGFAGLRLTRLLRKNKNIHITLVNDSPDFRYYPALYRVAVGFKMGIARMPLEWMLLDNSRVTLKIDQAVSVDSESKQVKLASGELLEYDELVCALGSVSTFFNIEGLHEHAFGIKSADEIIKLRQHIHQHVETGKDAEQNYVIIGGGPTGVELAASFGHYIKRVSKAHGAKTSGIRVWLVEAAPKLVPMMAEKVSATAVKRLRKAGVKVLLDTKVMGETINELKTSEGPIKTHTVIWTAGTTNNPFFAANPKVFPLNERGRVTVNNHMQVSRYIYVIGDNAAVQHAGLAMSAVRHADYVADDIARSVSKRVRKDFVPKVPMMVLPVGLTYAVFQYGKLIISGRVASWLRSAADLIGYKDVMGWSNAYSIWRNAEGQEEWCPRCAKKLTPAEE